MTIVVNTPHGKAAIVTGQEWSSAGPYKVVGPGAAAARDWLETAYGCFGHFIGDAAAPQDIHCAAMMLQQQPERGVTFVEARDVPNLPYTADIPKGATT